MLEFIASKAVNAKGQLEKINISFGVILAPLSINNQYRKVDENNKILVCNQLDNICSLLELAERNLIFSSGSFSQFIGQKFHPDAPSEKIIDLKEGLSIEFLLNSIIYYNSSFDYIKVLIKYIYSSYEDLVHEFPGEKVEKIMYKLGLEKNWDLALSNCITFIKDKKYPNWLRKKSNIPENIKNLFEELFKKNQNLKIKYQANQLKHGAVPVFRRTNPANALGSKIFESIEQFYLNKECKEYIYHVRPPENYLKIDEVQNFLIDYHNSTAKIINEIVEDIKNPKGEANEKKT
jgi:hypothetical protein